MLQAEGCRQCANRPEASCEALAQATRPGHECRAKAASSRQEGGLVAAPPACFNALSGSNAQAQAEEPTDEERGKGSST